MDLEQNLRTVSDDMLRTLEQLQILETQKRGEQPGTPSFVKLATEIEKLAAVVFRQTAAQHALAEQTAATEEGAELPPIEEMVAARDVSLILADWRDAERRLGASAMDSAEHAKAAADVRRLRDEYHRAHDAQAGDEGRGN
jgi:hypothetical protein